MSTNDCERRLARTLDSIQSYENQIEDIRVELAQKNGFNPNQSFRKINQSSSGFITQNELEIFLKNNGLFPSTGDLKQFFGFEKGGSSAQLTYNDFLNQILPRSDIDLRHACLERSNKQFDKSVEQNSGDIDLLITEIFQKEIEYTKSIEVHKKRLLEFTNPLLNNTFLQLADEITNYLSFKSISGFMKQNGLAFGKNEYESLMRRIDKNHKNRISTTELRFLILADKALMEPIYSFNHEERSHNKLGSVFDGISPIKNLNGSPNKNTFSATDVKIPPGTSRGLEASAHSDHRRRLSPSGHNKSLYSPDVRIPAEKPASQNSPYKSDEHYSPEVDREQIRKSIRSPTRERESHRVILYNEEINAIKDNLINQNMPEGSYYNSNSQNPLEWRFLDPTYHSYWNYHRDHNTTLSPDYFKKIQSEIPAHNHNFSKASNNTRYFNPAFIEPGSNINFHRYPENPFRHTDHGHYFRNYYSGLRNSYYDRYYHYVPYTTKLANTTGVNFNQQKGSPNNSKEEGYNHHSVSRPRSQPESYNNYDNPIPQFQHTRTRINPVQKNSLNIQNTYSDVQVDRQYDNQHEDDTPYQYIVLPNSKRSGDAHLKLHSHDKQLNREIEGIHQAKEEFEIRDYDNEELRIDPTSPEFMEDKPYTFVVLNGKDR